MNNFEETQNVDKLSSSVSSQELNNNKENSRFENNIYYQPKKIIVKMSDPKMGLGVFATEKIEKDELIERCPMIQLSWRRNYFGDPQIHRYLYTGSHCICKECRNHGSQLFMVLGYGMLYNHQDDPNTEWVFNFENLIGDVIAKKPIEAGEEIFVSYGNTYFEHREKHIIKRD